MSVFASESLPPIRMFPPGCCFSFATSSATFSRMIVELFQPASSSVVEATYLGACSS
jgi:hypothetical protein